MEEKEKEKPKSELVWHAANDYITKFEFACLNIAAEAILCRIS